MTSYPFIHAPDDSHDWEYLGATFQHAEYKCAECGYVLYVRHDQTLAAARTESQLPDCIDCQIENIHES